MDRRRWFNGLVGYIIYPTCYCDSNGDGIGDLKGMISKLDYLADLGVNLVWICPVNDSPMADSGYDVRDYGKINPLLGTMDDYRRLINEAHKRGILVMLDLPLNHTSDEHPWFRKAISSHDSRYQDYYIFYNSVVRDGKVLPINNWKGFFSTSTWTYVPGIDKEYFHIFSEKMPDVDWRCRALRDEYVGIMNRYLALGVDGFRLDAVAHLGKDWSFRDYPGEPDENGLVHNPAAYSNRKEVFGYLHYLIKRLRSDHPFLTIGEVGGSVSPRRSLLYTDKDRGPLDMVFNFDTCWSNGAYGSVAKSDDEIKTDVVNLKYNFLRWYRGTHRRAKGMPVYWENHDHPRVLSQYGDVRFRKASAKMLVTTLLFMYGTPFIYFGDEIGMSNVTYDRADDFRSVDDVNFVKELRGHYDEGTIVRFLNRTSRTSARTPMQWSGGANAGFSEGEPFERVNANYREVNVEDELKDPDSILNYYRKAIRLRKGALRKYVLNDFHIYRFRDPNVFCYFHKRNGRRLVLAANFAKADAEFTLPWLPKKIVLANQRLGKIGKRRITLPPFAVILYLA